MKHKKKLLLLLVLISFILSGCDIKFIEKVAPETKETTYNLGEIKEDPTETDYFVESSESTENNEIPSNEEEKEDDVIKVGDFTFNYTDSIQMYCLETTKAKILPEESATDYIDVLKGDIVIQKAVSSDKKWAMVKIEGGPNVYMLTKTITTDVVYADSIEETLFLETSETTTEKPIEKPPVIVTTTESAIVNTISTIPYPTAPISESYNFGVKFADVEMTITVTKNSVTINTGPGKILNSTGYSALSVVNFGDTLTCTGIGENGYLRVITNGLVGFIDGKNVQ